MRVVTVSRKRRLGKFEAMRTHIVKERINGGRVSLDVVIDQPIDDMGMAKAKDVPGTNLKKTHVRAILEDKVTADIGHFELSIVGYLTSYKGALYIDNIELK